MSSSNAAFPMSAMLSFVIQYMTRRGFNLSDILAGSELSDNAYLQPESTLTCGQELAIYANIQHMAELAGIDDIGLSIGANATANNVGMLGGLVANAVDVNHAGYLLRRFHKLNNRWFAPDLIGTLSPGKTIVRYRPTVELGTLHRLLMNLSLRGTQQLLSEIFGSPAAAFVHEIAFGYPAPSDPDYYRTALNCPVSYGHSFTCVTFDNDVGKLVNTKRNEFSYNIFLQCCRNTAFSLEPPSWQQRTLDALSCIDTYPRAATMAEALNCSERSLRRHLKSEGVQYSELIDKIRAERAIYLLSHSSDSIKKIGYQLSYSEPAAFIHSFSRWTGSTPTDFRRRITMAKDRA